MIALAFRAGPLRYALAAAGVVQVLPRRRLRPLPLAPDGVIGLLAFRGHLLPVVDLCVLLLQRPTQPLRSSRIIVCECERGGRQIGLLAEEVLDLIDIEDTVPGLALPAHPWLGDHLGTAPEAPQLIEPSQLLPAALAALFSREAPA